MLTLKGIVSQGRTGDLLAMTFVCDHSRRGLSRLLR